jgi:hypothetical protein
MSPLAESRAITRDDIEAKLREIQGGASVGADAAKGAGLAAGLFAVAVVVLLAYLFGRRRGRRRRTVVEVRRV